jgi:hypothetical protein
VLHADGEHLLDWRPRVTPNPITVLAAEKDKAASEILNPSAIQLHGLTAQSERRKVAQQEQVELLKVG